MAKQRFRSMEDYEASCTFKWKCVYCKSTIWTPPPQRHAEDDWDETPIHCEEYMEATEAQ